MKEILESLVEIRDAYILNPEDPLWIAYSFQAETWHGLIHYLPGKPESTGIFWAQERENYQKWSKELGWDQIAYLGDGWILSRWQAHGGETVYGPRPHIEDPAELVKAACSLVLQDHPLWRGLVLAKESPTQKLVLKLQDAVELVVQ